MRAMNVVVLSADRTLPSGHPANLGDAFLTDSLVESLAEAQIDAVALDFGSARKSVHAARRRVSGLSGLARQVRSADAVVIGGGTLLQDDSGGRIAGLPRLMAVASALGWALRTPVYFFGVGCDPIKRPVPRLLLRAALWRRRVWVRDEPSLERCAGLGVPRRRLRLGADVSLLFAGRVADRHRVEPVGEDIPGAVVALAKADATGLIPEHVQQAVRRWGPVAFVQMYQDEGAGDASTLAAGTRRELSRVTAGLTWSDALSEIARADVVVASRMHALYMALMTGTPAIPVGHLAKVRSFAEEFGYGSPAELATLDQATPIRGDTTALISATERGLRAFAELVGVMREEAG